MIDLGIRPFNARSLILSVLLGLPEPRLPAAAPGRLAELFGISRGTMRTALSRMVAGGELAVLDGDYELRGPLIERKAAQDVGRRPADDRWDGSWWVVTVVSPNRELATRREFRVAMANARMGELRPDTWVRPANLDVRFDGDDLAAVRGPVHGVEATTLTQRLWDLPAIERRGAQLLSALEDGLAALSSPTARTLPDGMPLAAAVVRFLRSEPLLPHSLTPDLWSVDELRRRYGAYDRAFGLALRQAIGLDAATPSRR